MPEDAGYYRQANEPAGAATRPTASSGAATSPPLRVQPRPSQRPGGLRYYGHHDQRRRYRRVLGNTAADDARVIMGSRWYRDPMEAVIDQAGRVVLPKPIRDALGLLPGTKVDISAYGAGVQVVPAGRTARLVEEDGVLVAAGETPVDDDVVFALIDAGRK
jgi:AbrB family looped-hinge helix DNA binding protein